MKVKDIVLTAAGLLGIAQEVRGYIDGEGNGGKANTESLLQAFNLIEGELALDYLPLLAEEIVAVEDGSVAYKKLSKTLARIIAVRDESGKDVRFTLLPTQLRVDEKRVKVEYAYLPESKDLDGETDYESRASVGLIAYGVAAAYCAARGLYAEAEFWDKKYKACLARICGKSRGGRIRGRTWV